VDDPTQPPVPTETAVLITHGDRVAFVNAAATRLLAAPADQLVGRRPGDLFADDAHQTVAARVGKLPPERGLAGPVTARVLRADGTDALVEVTATALADASGPGVLWFLRDLVEAAAVTEAVATARKTGEQLRLAVRASNIGLWDWDIRTNRVAYSPEWKSQLGYAADEVRGEFGEWERRLHPDDRGPVLERIRRAIDSGQPTYEVEFRLRHRDGSWRWMLTRAEVIRDAAGTPVRVLGCHVDVTDRKRAEEALRASEERLRLAQHAGRVGIFDWDVATGRSVWTEVQEAIYGLPRGTFEGGHSDWARRVHPDDLPRISAELEECFSARRAENAQEFRIVRPDGEVRWVTNRGQITYAPDGQPLRMVGTTIDVTERRQAEETLREREARLAAVLDTATDAIITIDDRGRIESANPATERLFGYPPAELTGRNVSVLMPPPYHAEHDQYLARYRETGEKRVIGVGREVVGRRKDGTTFPMDLSVTEFLTPARGFTGFVRDITDRKQLESRSLRAQRLESIGTLASGIAHDLNNVLTPVLVAVKLLLKDRPGLDRKTLLETARASIERGAGMIRQLLAFGGGLAGEQVPVAVPDLVAEVNGMLAHTLPKSVALTTSVAGGPWPTRGDPTQLTQVLVNLCVNARDAMPAGGTISVRVTNQAVDDRWAAQNPGARPGRYVVVSVTDTGGGMTREVQERIFDPFFTTKPFGQGTGLGLATVRGIVKAHGGFVTVYSEPGKGSRFSVYLPAADQAAPPAATSGAPDPHRGRGELILVVDDEPHVLTVARAVLEGACYRVVTADGGAAALVAFRHHRGEVAAAVLDMMMPGMDGLELLARLRAADPGVRVVAASGLRPTGPDAETLAAAGAVFVPKPYSDDELLAALAGLLHPTAG
jgi:two-component system cell cycle sensor histidine kinase/response regulator CckA